MRATAASRNVGTNGQGLGAGEVIGDSFVSHPEDAAFELWRGVPHDTQQLQGREGLVRRRRQLGALEPPIFEMRKLRGHSVGEDA
jgi:hypothetical protein